MTRRSRLRLSPDERLLLNRIAETGNAAESRRAHIILLSARGLSQIEVAADVGLSERQVRRWQRAFQARRMAIFPSVEKPAPETPSPESPPPRSAPPEKTPPEPAVPSPPPPGVTEPRRPLKLQERSGIQPDDPMSEAGRKILDFHFERMLLHEPGSRQGEDAEAVHDMRVATRRMRSALRLFAPFYRRKVIRPLVRDLRQTARALGAVRDRDVFIEKLAYYQETLPPGTGDSLAPLLEYCRLQRDMDRARLIAHLDSPDFERFVATFETFLTTPGLGTRKFESAAPAAYQVRHVAPRLIYTHYEAVRAYETVLDRASVETLHALRIECKRLRYALEFFSEVMGEEVQGVIDALKQLQDHLGNLNDVEVAGDFLRRFISDYEQTQTGVPLAERRSIEGVVQYMAHQFAEKHRLTVTFADAWAAFNRPGVRRDLGLAVAAL